MSPPDIRLERPSRHPRSSINKPTIAFVSTIRLHTQQCFKVLAPNIQALLWNTINFHPEMEFLKSSIPRTNPIGPGWAQAIIGLKSGTVPPMFVVPSLPELRRRIALSLDAAIVQKRLTPGLGIFSKMQGYCGSPLMTRLM
jgi:hypothetical protein